jgi:hypothetical protein
MHIREKPFNEEGPGASLILAWGLARYAPEASAEMRRASGNGLISAGGGGRPWSPPPAKKSAPDAFKRTARIPQAMAALGFSAKSPSEGVTTPD